jgi:predicted permease
VPLGLSFGRRGIAVEGYQPGQGEDMEFGASHVGPGYFATMGVRLVRGRDFTDRDRAGAPRVAVVNETFARKFWPGRDAIGRRISDGIAANPADTEWYVVVGVAADGKYRSLGEEPQPFFYLPLLQEPASSATLVVRTTGAIESVTRALRAAVSSIDRAMPVIAVRDITDHLAISLLPSRLAGLVLGTMGATGLLLAALGLYGVLAHAVARRTREFGVRLSLGAPRATIVRLVLHDGLVLTAVGLGAGLGLALAGGRLVSSMLFGIHPADPATLAGVAILLTVTALVACLVPARRAMRVDPVVALRTE